MTTFMSSHLPPPLPGVAKWGELRDLPVGGSGASRRERDTPSVAEGGVRARLGTRCAYGVRDERVCVCARPRFSSISDSFFVTLRARITPGCGALLFPAYACAAHPLRTFMQIAWLRGCGGGRGWPEPAAAAGAPRRTFP